MKKLVLLIAFLLVTSICLADGLPALEVEIGKESGLVIGLDNMSAGTYYDVRHREVLAGFQVSVIDWQRIVSIDVGVLTDAHSTPWLIGAGIDVGSIASMIGWNYNLPAALHLTTFVARDLTLSWDEGGRWGFAGVVKF
jgi:hypothetical protein